MKIALILSIFINFILGGAIYVMLEDKKSVEKTFIKKLKNCDPGSLEK